MVPQQMTKDVQYTVCVPKTEARTSTVTVCKMVPQEEQVTYTVCVPHQVQKDVQVRVCKMVQKTVSVPACDPCADAGCGRKCRQGCLAQRRACRQATTDCCAPAAEACCN
jgi:hypothetical protein